LEQSNEARPAASDSDSVVADLESCVAAMAEFMRLQRRRGRHVTRGLYDKFAKGKHPPVHAFDAHGWWPQIVALAEQRLQAASTPGAAAS
jgi:hypothetical protein